MKCSMLTYNIFRIVLKYFYANIIHSIIFSINFRILRILFRILKKKITNLKINFINLKNYFINLKFNFIKLKLKIVFLTNLGYLVLKKPTKMSYIAIYVS